MTIQITIAAEIQLRGLSRDLRLHFQAKNTFDNPAWHKQKAMGLWTGNTPTHLKLWREHEGVLFLPRGYIREVLDKLADRKQDVELVDATVCPVVEYPAVTGELWPEQEQAIRALVERKSGVLEAPTASGKTNVLLSILPRLRTRGLVLVHTKDLLTQTLQRCRDWLGLEPGQVGAGKWKLGPEVTVGMMQTLAARELAEIAPLFGAVMVDECLVAGTIVDGQRIEDVRPGDFVTGWSESNQAFESHPVLRTMKRLAPHRLIEISAGGRTIVCTEEHPVWTREGWKPARLLYAGCYMMQCTTNKEKNHANSVQQLREKDGSNDTTSAPASEEWRQSLLQIGVRFSLGTTEVQRNDGGYQSQICQRADDKSQPYEERIGSREATTEPEAYGVEAANSWWEREASSRDPAVACLSIGLAGRSHCEDWEEGGVSQSLQGRHCSRGITDGNRGGWWISPSTQGSSRRQAEGQFFEIVRVDRIEIHEQGGCGQFGKVCRDGHVYNLAVGVVNNYVANGLLVHNCHHAPAGTWTKVLSQLPARYKFGFTATPTRKDGLTFLLWRVIGEKLWTIPKRSIEAAGRIVAPSRTRVSTGWTYRLESKTDWGEMISAMVANERRNQLIAGEVKKLGDRTVLVLSERIGHVEVLARMLEDERPILLHGKLKKALRVSRMLEVRAGARLTVATSNLMGEGVDVPGWEVVVLATPFSWKGSRRQQAIGRITRSKPGKTSALVIEFRDEIIFPVEAPL